jgi:hypothetical protein
MTPYPSLRLEVIRDGIEDYEYLALLKHELVRAAKLKNPKHDRILNKFKTLLRVPDEITSSMTRFTKNPVLILQRRSEIAAAIEKLEAIERNAQKSSNSPAIPK